MAMSASVLKPIERKYMYMKLHLGYFLSIINEKLKVLQQANALNSVLLILKKKTFQFHFFSSLQLRHSFFILIMF